MSFQLRSPNPDCGFEDLTRLDSVLVALCFFRFLLLFRELIGCSFRLGLIGFSEPTVNTAGVLTVGITRAADAGKKPPPQGAPKARRVADFEQR